MPKRPATGLSQAVRPERVRAAVLEVLGRVREEGQLADRALAQVLRRERSLLSGERRAVAEAVYTELRDESLPEWLVQQLQRELGDTEAAALVGALNGRAPLTLRANTLKATRDALLARLQAEGLECSPTRYSPWGVHLHSTVNLFALPAFKDGWFEIQDEGSQLIALLCAARPGQRVVDACAGGGGKTLALAVEMNNRGELWALDSSAKRLAQLKPRARRAGVHNVRSVCVDPEGPFPAALAPLSGAADVVLVDAPCSGTGALRRNPDARRRLTPEGIQDHARRQLDILGRMAQLVRPGGLLVYATCSILRAEDEEVLATFARRGGHEPVPLASLIGAERADLLGAAVPAALFNPYALRMWPQHHGTDGFFAAALRRGAAG